MRTEIEVESSEKRAKKPAGPSVVLPLGCEALIGHAQIAQALGVTVRQVHSMISAGEYPQCDLRVGSRPRWRVETHNRWIVGQSARPKG